MMQQTTTASGNRKHTFRKGSTITLAALMLALGGAVCLNWSFANAAPESVSAAAGAEETAFEKEVVPVLDPLTGEAEEVIQEQSGKNYGEAQLVSLSKDSSTEFFEQARLVRSRSRDEALDTLKKTLEDTNLTQEEKNALTEQLQGQISNITVESSLETLIKAKGFADCVIMLDGSRATVTVMTENDALTAEEVARIRDVMLNKCKGLTAQNITVVEVK